MKISKKIIVKLINNEIIKDKDKEIYEYGLNGLFFMGINLIVTVGVSFIVGIIGQIVLLLLFFVPLRSFAGGLHVKNKILCCLLSNIAIYSDFFLCDNLSLTGNILLFVINSLIVWLWGPVENENRKLSSNENKLYKEKILRIIICYYIIFVFMILFRWDSVITSLSAAVSLSGILVMLGISKNRQRDGHY